MRRQLEGVKKAGVALSNTLFFGVFRISCLASGSAESRRVCAVHFADAKPSVGSVPRAAVPSIIGAMAAGKTTITIASWPSAISAAIAGIVAINKLATFSVVTVVPIIVAMSTSFALITESRPR